MFNVRKAATNTDLKQIEQLEKTIEEKQKKVEKVERNIRNARVRMLSILHCVVLILFMVSRKTGNQLSSDW